MRQLVKNTSLRLFFIHFIVLLTILTACGYYQPSHVQTMTIIASSKLSDLHIPYTGDGQLATVWSAGRNLPPIPAMIYLTTKNSTRQFELDGVSHIRWLLNDNLIIQQLYRNSSNALDSRLMEVNVHGEVIKEFNIGAKLTYPEISHDGQYFIAGHTNKNGNVSFEVRRLTGDFEIISRYGESQIINFLSDPIWSPYDTQFAAGLWIPDEDQSYWPILAIISKDGSMVYPMGSTVKEQAEPAGIKPVFWLMDGVYGKSDRGLLKCSPQGQKCRLLYSPGKHRLILSGTPVSDGRALLLVLDLQSDPYEVRAKEIHEVNLSNGEGKVLMRPPDDVYVSSIDWRP